MHYENEKDDGSLNKAYGIHTVKSILVSKKSVVSSLFLSDKRQDRRLLELEKMATRRNIQVNRVPAKQLNEMVEGQRHQGAVIFYAQARGKKSQMSMFDWLDSLASPNLLVVLDSIQDPRNLGACIRSANAAGAGGVIISKNRGCAVTDTVTKTAAGAVEVTPIYESSNLARDLKTLKTAGFWVIGLDPEAEESLYDSDLTEHCAIVFGSEGDGLRLQTKQNCDWLARIPIAGQVESLNVSVCVGVATFEVNRQRMYKP